MEYPKFKVCVKCITYNQSKYIEDSMNGFTIQQTDFPFVCCIIDDASTDGEQEVIRSYLKAHFEMGDSSVAFEKETDYANIIYAQHKNNKNCYFAVLLLKKNLFKQGDLKLKYISEWRDLCEYEALCEGDDYWIEPKKLQMQADFLDKNQDYGLCYTKAYKYYQRNKYLSKSAWGGTSESYIQFLISNPIPTLTVVMRHKIVDEFLISIKPWQFDWKMGDLPMWLYISHQSKVKFVNVATGVYRVNDNSASQSECLDDFLKFMESARNIRQFYIRYFDDKIDLEYINSGHYRSISSYCLFKFNNRKTALKYLQKIPRKTFLDYLKIVVLRFNVLSYLYNFKIHY